MNHRPSHTAFKEKALKDLETQKYYQNLEEEFSILRELIQARQEAGKTQKEIAQNMGTKTSSIGRLESSLFSQKHSPKLSTLHKYAKAVGCHLKIHLVKN